MRRTTFTFFGLLVAAFIIASALSCGEKAADDEKEKYVTGKIPLDGKSPLREIPKEGELNYLTPKPEDKGDYTEFYTIQLGAFSSLENAHRLLSDLKGDGYDVFLFESHIKSDSLYKVGLGTFEKKEDARAYLDNLVIPGFEGLWITQVRYGSAVKLDTEKDKGEAPEKTRVAEMVYVSDKAVDGDGGAEKWGVWLKREEEEDPLLLAESKEGIRRPIISPDGKRVAFIVVGNEAGGGKISIADTYGSKKVSTIPAPVPLNHHIWISEEVLAYVSTSPSEKIANKIVIYNIIKRKGDILISSKENLFENLILSPNGKYLAYDAHSASAGYDSAVLPKNVESDEAVHVETINLETGSKRVVRAGYTTKLMGWYPDGNLMVAYHLEPGRGKSYDYSFASSDPEGKNIVMLEDIKTVRNVGPGVSSPDGRRIAFVTWKLEDDGKSKRRTPKELWLLYVDGGDAKRLLKRDSILYGPSWSPEGDELAITGRIKNRLNVFVVGDLGTGDDGAAVKSPKVKRLFDIDDNSYDATFH